MIKNSKRKILIMIALVILLIVALSTIVQAGGLKSEPSGTRLVNRTAMEFFTLIRSMQSPTGTLGVSSEDGNKINCHMSKNTEWGTAAILSASKYGVVPSGNASTTGNNTGVFKMGGSWEYVAGVYEGSALVNDANNNYDKYVNRYSSHIGINGDGLTTASGRVINGRL